jgi:hypothetical protein
MRSPDHRAAAVAASETVTGALEQGLKDLLEGKEAPEEVKYAYSIYDDAYKSEVLEAFLLADMKHEDISAVIRVPVTIIETYRYLFFDKAVFQDELDVEAYAQNYPEDTKEERWGKDLKIAAVTLGAEYLTYRFSRKEAGIDLANALKSMIINAYMLTKVTKLNPLDSNTAREARGWAGTAIKALEAYVRVKPATENSDDEWRIALETIERTTNETKSGIKREDIVH